MAYSDVPKTSPVFGACQSGILPTFSGCAAGIAPAYSGCLRGGDTPVINNIAPGSMKAGLVVAITINGSFLGAVTGVLITPNTLIAVTNINVVNDNQLIVTFTLDVAAAEGVRTIAVVTPIGTSNAVNVTILPGMWLGITTEPVMWLEADYGVVDANNAAMTIWSDRSSFGNHMRPAVGKGAPIYKSAGWNGSVSRPYWQFNNAHGCEALLSASLNFTSFSMFVIFERDAGDANSTIIFILSTELIVWGLQDNAATSYCARYNAPHTFLGQSSYQQPGFLPVSTRHHIRVEYNGTHASHKLYKSGAQQVLTNQLVDNPGIANTGSCLVRLGWRDVALPGFDMQGRIAAAVLYGTQLSAPDTAIVHGQLHPKWMS